jgi:hypothetical protein
LSQQFVRDQIIAVSSADFGQLSGTVQEYDFLFRIRHVQRPSDILCSTASAVGRAPEFVKP